MTTLYDLLGALPGDDADDLRDAFRRAVKDVHPDIRPNDPDAALNFRLIVYAMEVLRDPELRAAYDYLLDRARQELVSQRRAAKIRTFAFAMIGLAGVSVVVVSAGTLFAPTLPGFGQIEEFFHAAARPASSGVSTDPASNDSGATANRDAATTKPPEEQEDFLTRWGPNDIDAKADPKAGTGPPAEKQDDLPPRSDAQAIDADHSAEIGKPVAESAIIPPQPDANDKNAPADREVEAAPVVKEDNLTVRPSDPNPPAPHDAADDVTALLDPDDKTDASAIMHAKGIVAYRKGDLDAALANLSRAIELNPTFMLAYVNRGIVLYRMGKLDLALADVARARRIDRAGHGGPTTAVHGKRHRDTSAIENPAATQAAGL
jgi:curved DNA-binding protein CbpA